MIRYVFKRILWMAVIVIAVAVLIFSLMYLAPGDPVSLILGANATQEQIMAERANLGLDQPYLVQLWNFLCQLFIHFDLGTSYVYRTSVATELVNRVPNTLKIAGICMLIQIVVGIITGTIAALNHNKAFDRISMISSIFLVSVPGFWLALLMVLLFSLKLGWLPAFGIGGIVYLIMPCVSNAIAPTAGQSRLTRSSVLEIMNEDYVTMGKAMGLKNSTILIKFILPNAMIPILAMIGGSLASCLGGAVIVETVFAIPGTGQYISNAIGNRDYPVVRGTVVVLAIFFAFVMLLVDLAYAFIDPRIKAQYANQRRRKRKAGTK